MYVLAVVGIGRRLLSVEKPQGFKPPVFSSLFSSSSVGLFTQRRTGSAEVGEGRLWALGLVERTERPRSAAALLRPFALLPLFPGQWARLPDSSLSRILMVAQWAPGPSIPCMHLICCMPYDPSVSRAICIRYLLSIHLM